MFEVDDLLQFGLDFGFEKSDHTHEIAWRFCDANERGSYVSVEVEFKCGCTFDGADRIKKLQMVLKSLNGWEISKSYLGGYNGRYIVRVLKSSMRND